MLSDELINIVALVIFLVCITVYSLGLVYSIKKPRWGERGFLNIMYGLWVKRMMDPKETVIAVQTMRNLIMATTFLSSSMLLLLGLLLTAPANHFDDLFSLSATSAEQVGEFKLLIFIAIIVFSIIMFLLSLRQMVRFSILIGIPTESIETIVANQRKTKNNAKDLGFFDAEELKKDVFIRAMNRFTFGMRAVFYGITLLLWFLSVYAFIIGTLCLTAYLIFHRDVETLRHGILPI
jgi:uncharacterized membrane protein